MSPDQLKQYATTCVHFNGLECGACSAGVVYETVKQKGFRALLTEPRYPCTEPLDDTQCQRKLLPTPEQIAKKRADAEAAGKLVSGAVAARALINRDRAGLRGVTGVVTCPVCGNQLKYRSIPYSEALVFKCDREGCLNVSDK